MNPYIFTLCIIQGVSEFLPISSSAHLTLINLLWNQPPSRLEWEVALHLGTLLSIIIYFRDEVFRMIKASFSLLKVKNWPSYRYDPDGQLALLLVTATLPAIIIGYLIKNKVNYFNQPFIIGVSSIIFGILLYLADIHQHRRPQKLTFFKSFFIGCAQALAFIPGSSRSGTCITAARYLGLGRIEATRFAFLLSIPTVLGAVTLTGYEVFKQSIILDWAAISQAVGITAVLGFIVIHGMLSFLKRHSFKPFMIYRVAFGLGLLIFAYYKPF